MYNLLSVENCMFCNKSIITVYKEIIWYGVLDNFLAGTTHFQQKVFTDNKHAFQNQSNKLIFIQGNKIKILRRKDCKNAIKYTRRTILSFSIWSESN